MVIGAISAALIWSNAKKHSQATDTRAADSVAASVACQDTTRLPATIIQDIGMSRMHVILETPTRRADCYYQYGRITGVFMRRKVAR